MKKNSSINSNNEVDKFNRKSIGKRTKLGYFFTFLILLKSCYITIQLNRPFCLKKVQIIKKHTSFNWAVSAVLFFDSSLTAVLLVLFFSCSLNSNQ